MSQNSYLNPNSGFGDEALIAGASDTYAHRLMRAGWTALVPTDKLAELSTAALSTARQLFALPYERKRSFARPDLGGHVGWRDSSREDRPEEVWQIQVSNETEDWPMELYAERRALNHLGVLCARITKHLLAALVNIIDDPEISQRLGTCVSHERTIVRLLHYQPRLNSLSFAPHTDLGITTIFAGETISALELEEEHGLWVTPDSQLVLAAGEILAACTRNRVRPGQHRVRSVQEERWAVAVFVHPEPNYEIGFDAKGLPITAQAFFERSMAAYSQEGSDPTPMHEETSDTQNGCRTKLSTL